MDSGAAVVMDTILSDLFRSGGSSSSSSQGRGSQSSSAPRPRPGTSTGAAASGSGSAAGPSSNTVLVAGAQFGNSIEKSLSSIRSASDIIRRHENIHGGRYSLPPLSPLSGVDTRDPDPSAAISTTLCDLGACMGGIQAPLRQMSTDIGSGSFVGACSTTQQRIDRMTELNNMKQALQNLSNAAAFAARALGQIEIEARPVQNRTGASQQQASTVSSPSPVSAAQNGAAAAASQEHSTPSTSSSGGIARGFLNSSNNNSSNNKKGTGAGAAAGSTSDSKAKAKKEKESKDSKKSSSEKQSADKQDKKGDKKDKRGAKGDKDYDDDDEEDDDRPQRCPIHSRPWHSPSDSVHRKMMHNHIVNILREMNPSQSLPAVSDSITRRSALPL
jgi:hypothetical protein